MLKWLHIIVSNAYLGLSTDWAENIYRATWMSIVIGSIAEAWVAEYSIDCLRNQPHCDLLI